MFASVEFKQGEAVAPSGAAAFSHACTLCRRHGVPPENGGARPPSAMPLLADAPTRLKRYARLPCRCAAAALSGLRRCGGSAGARPLRRGRGCPAGSPVAPGCSPLRSFPAAPWVAALPSRSLGGAVAVARRAWAAAPPSLRSVACVAAARPARLPAAPCSRLRSRGGAARPLGRSLRSRPAAAWWASRPPRVLARCGAGVAAAAGKEKAGLAAGFPGKRRIRTPFSCR